MKRFLLVSLFVILAATLILVFRPGSGGSPRSVQAKDDARETPNGSSNERVVNVVVTKVQPEPLKDIIVLPGSTSPWQDVTLAANEGGRVEWVGVKEGDRVKKEQLIAKVDVSMLKAQLDNAQADFNLAHQLYLRRNRLFERRIISREELDQARTSRTVKEGSLRQAQVAYDHGFIYSPIDGVVNDVFVDPGEYVAKGGEVAEVVNVDRIQIDVDVPELDVRTLTKGAAVMFRVDAVPDRDFGGVIEFVAFKADPKTKTFRIKITLENQEMLIRPGMIVRVAILRRMITDALVVPLFALVDKGGERVLFVEEDGVARARTVSLGVIDGDRIQITDGLKPGDNIIVTGQTEVVDGARVQTK